MVYFEFVKVTIDVLGLAKVIINMVLCHYDIFESIVTDQNFLFMSKFWPLLCYFLGSKKRLFTAFHSQING